MCDSCKAMAKVLKFLLEDLNSTLCMDTVEIIEHTLSQYDGETSVIETLAAEVDGERVHDMMVDAGGGEEG